MDYIAEELRRQREVWHALLNAAAPHPKTEPARPGEEETRPSPAEADPMPERQRRDETPPRRLARSGQTPQASAPPQASDPAPAQPEETEKTAALRALQSSLSRRSALRRQRFAPPAGEEKPEITPVSPAVFREPLLRARELSRTVERDARRYDGGFSPL